MCRYFLLLASLLFANSTLNAEEIYSSNTTTDPYINAVYDIANDVLSTHVRMKACSKFSPEFEEERSAAYRNYQAKNVAILELFLEHYRTARNIHSGSDPVKYAAITKYYSDRLESYYNRLVDEFSLPDKTLALNHCQEFYTYLNSTDAVLATKYAKQIALVKTTTITVMPPSPDK